MSHRGLALVIALTACLSACGGASDGDPGEVDAGAPGADGSADAAPPRVSLENLSALLDGENVFCATNGSDAETACPDYFFRFVLRNDASEPVEVVDYLRLAFDSEELYNETPGLCTLTPWAIGPGEESELIRIHFSYTRESSTDGGFRPRFYYECGGGRTRTYAPGPYSYGDAMPSLPTAGLVTLEVQGLLADGTEFVAGDQAALNP